MKKRPIKQLVIGVLIIILMRIPAFSAEISQNVEIDRANLTFKEMKYEHMEYRDIEELLNKAKTIVMAGDEGAFYEWDKEFYNEYCKLQTMIQIAHLSYQLNTDSTDYFEEYLYSVELLGKMKTGYTALFEEDELYSKGMQVYYELSIERNKLVDLYYNQEEHISIMVDGIEMNISQILICNTLSKEQKRQYCDEWYTAYNEATGEIFLKLVNIDNQIAEIQGYDSYVAYMYDSYERDYTLEESKIFIQNVKQVVPKVFKKLYSKGISAAYNLQAYSYEDEEKLLSSIGEHFISEYDIFKKAYNYLIKYNLYDLSNRDNKVSGGLTIYFDSFEEPFIFINYNRQYETALTFIHEFGHYFSYFQVGNHEGGLDLDETYSQAMELLAMPYYGAVLGDEALGKEAHVYIVDGLITAIIEGCLYEEFLQQVYENPNQTVQELNELYTKLASEYGVEVDGRSWCEVSHNYEMPFYYLSYSVSAVAALEVWEQSLIDQEIGMQTYLSLIEAARNNTFLEALEEAGLNNPLDKETLEKVMESVETYFDFNAGVHNKAA